MTATALPRRRTRAAPVVLWAAAGGAILAFELYVLTKWVTGPNFASVGVGPVEPPAWNKALVIGWQVVSWPLLGATLYWFAVRPWRRERRIATDGLLCAVWITLIFWEPLSSYFENWFTYNSYAVNRGSWVADVPGWQSSAHPGAMVVEPLLWSGPAYCYALFTGTVLCGAVLRRVRARHPEIGRLGLFACAWGFLLVADLLLEGVIWMPMQMFTTAGGMEKIWIGSFNEFALSEMVFWSLAWASIACVRFFTDDAGRTLPERGLERLGLGRAPSAGVRFLALLGLCTTLYVAAYTVPTALLMKEGAETWPRAIETRSYLTDGICGVGTPRDCRPEH